MSATTWLRQRLPLRATWPTVARELGLSGTTVSKVKQTALGVEVALRLTPPTTCAVVERSADALAVAYGAARVRVQPSVSRADQVRVLIDFTRDIGNVTLPDFHHPIGIPLDPMRPFALGIDDDGAVVFGAFYGHHILVGGIPGSGKSNALRVFLAHLAASRRPSGAANTRTGSSTAAMSSRRAPCRRSSSNTTSVTAANASPAPPRSQLR